MPLFNGIDIVDVSRIRQAVRRSGDRFLKRIYTDAELVSAEGRPDSLAVHWAAKEATMKTIGLGLYRIPWHDIEVQYEPAGRPFLVLRGVAARRAAELGLKTFAISLSHERGYAIASVVAMG